MTNNKLGLLYSSITLLFWGILPIALKLSEKFIDATSLSWFRFFIAFIVIFILQLTSNSLQQFRKITLKEIIKLLFAGIFLTLNYVTFVLTLKYLSPGEAQLNFQVAPFFLAFGSLLFFKERLTAIQLSCLFTLAVGIILFFHPNLSGHINTGSKVLIGVGIIEFSALSWACYTLLQKSLMAKLSTSNVLLCVFGVGMVLLTPLTDFTRLSTLSGFDWSIALFCALNTLIAYSALAKALVFWPAAQVSAVVAVAPVISFMSSAFVVTMGWWPNIIKAHSLSSLSILGIIVIVGSVATMQLLPHLLKKSKPIEQLN
ncbi:EamA/RhaT family transporter [Photobacterium sp. NCIMB 13483]|uniref:Putative inner membrane transporter YhbE n=1 Tax=Photobacterium piscicola TaxID=1378299 RepID=A0A1T5I025_9GAMM|nr:MULTISPECIES: DMT family transporter [Photobacterium]PST93502.1 EamA/RhaT family transporter [Photobacterium sp. NCIMB 13483]SKC32383.1 putative inner membrane transporter YhbE [Photobacterium piscicola]